MALRVAGLLRALETGLGRPKGGAPNPLFAQYVQGLEHRAAGADPVYPPCLLPPFPHPSAKTLLSAGCPRPQPRRCRVR